MQPSESSNPEKVGLTSIRTKKKDSTKESDKVLEYGPVILTGGHGGAVPAFIVWLFRKLARRHDSVEASTEKGEGS